MTNLFEPLDVPSRLNLESRLVRRIFGCQVSHHQLIVLLTGPSPKFLDSFLPGLGSPQVGCLASALSISAMRLESHSIPLQTQHPKLRDLTSAGRTAGPGIATRASSQKAASSISVGFHVAACPPRPRPVQQPRHHEKKPFVLPGLAGVLSTEPMACARRPPLSLAPDATWRV